MTKALEFPKFLKCNQNFNNSRALDIKDFFFYSIIKMSIKSNKGFRVTNRLYSEFYNFCVKKKKKY